MAYRNQFFVGVITGVLVSMVILGVLHLNNEPQTVEIRDTNLRGGCVFSQSSVMVEIGVCLFASSIQFSASRGLFQIGWSCKAVK